MKPISIILFCILVAVLLTGCQVDNVNSMIPSESKIESEATNSDVSVLRTGTYYWKSLKIVISENNSFSLQFKKSPADDMSPIFGEYSFEGRNLVKMNCYVFEVNDSGNLVFRNDLSTQLDVYSEIENGAEFVLRNYK